MDSFLKHLDTEWKQVLGNEFEKTYFKKLTAYIQSEYTSTKVFPLPQYVFAALNACPLSKVAVVTLGQDPYHGDNQAIGFSFAVEDGVPMPPSLKNIVKEVSTDTGLTPSRMHEGTYAISEWATQGVLLLNATLTVRKGQAGSHQGKGWEEFTDAIIKKISDEREHTVFMLWGAYAQKKEFLIDSQKHYVITSVHPSPLSARKGFFGSKPFSRANTYLKKFGKTSIRW